MMLDEGERSREELKARILTRHQNMKKLVQKLKILRHLEENQEKEDPEIRKRVLGEKKTLMEYFALNLGIFLYSFHFVLLIFSIFLFITRRWRAGLLSAFGAILLIIVTYSLAGPKRDRTIYKN